MNPGYVYSIVATVFSGIVVNAHSSSSFWPIALCDGMGAIGYKPRSPLVRIDSTLNSPRCISGVLRPVALPSFEHWETMFQQDCSVLNKWFL
ncbi:hypothetical protein TNCV_4593851 [Trichonephila clavipes]|uniref:Uncharacterized protein n=1 Tax=Trichonephila clavipes TaxID=2585209 RepID=A0A8X6WEY0_TRICX|nr:hypothetical protein TNCV_4593851 [Trichonephila clavipes]